MGEKFFGKKMCFIQKIQMIPHLAQSDIVTGIYSIFQQFLGIFGYFGESKLPPGGSEGDG